MLRQPTMAPEELVGIYNDQIGTLNNIRIDDIEKERSSTFVSFVLMRHLSTQSSPTVGIHHQRVDQGAC